jgi:hypothetical protein
MLASREPPAKASLMVSRKAGDAARAVGGRATKREDGEQGQGPIANTGYWYKRRSSRRSAPNGDAQGCIMIDTTLCLKTRRMWAQVSRMVSAAKDRRKTGTRSGGTAGWTRRGRGRGRGRGHRVVLRFDSAWIGDGLAVPWAKCCPLH